MSILNTVNLELNLFSKFREWPQNHETQQVKSNVFWELVRESEPRLQVYKVHVAYLKCKLETF